MGILNLITSQSNECSAYCCCPGNYSIYIQTQHYGFNSAASAHISLTCSVNKVLVKWDPGPSDVTPQHPLPLTLTAGLYLFAPAGGSTDLLIGCNEPINPSSYSREKPKLPAKWRRREPVSFCFKPLRCRNMDEYGNMHPWMYCICIMGKTWRMFPSKPPLCIGRTGLNVSCCSLWGSATLPRLLMPYLLLIRMSRLSATICCSCSTNLPAVWCWWGAQWPSCSVPAPDLKRPFRFVVASF